MQQAVLVEEMVCAAASVPSVSECLTLAGQPLDRATFACACVRQPVAYSLMRGLSEALSAVAEDAIARAFPRPTRSGLPDRRGAEWVASELPYEGPDPAARVLLVGIRRQEVVPSNWVALTFTEWFGDVVQQGLLPSADGDVEPWREMCAKVPPLASVGGRYLVVIEPAGTHGRRIAHVIARYKETGTPLGVIVLCAVATSGFCAHLVAEHPEVQIFALRLDTEVDANGFPSPGFVGAQYKLGVDPDLLREP